MAEQKPIPVGKLPADLLKKILKRAPVLDPRVILGPGIGLDCAILDLGDTILVLKADPITFATADIGWYAVQINANDIATTGAAPRWMTVTLLLPENQTTPDLVEQIGAQLFEACEKIGVSLIGGHTEITFGLDRPILSATMIGEAERNQLITPRGAQVGDCLLLTKGVPIEATAILAREFPERLTDTANPTHLSMAELAQAQNYLFDPGISVLTDARLAIENGTVHAMHDPTEGGLSTALWELAQACGHSLVIDLNSVYISPISTRICQSMGINPMAAIASGALLIAVPQIDAEPISQALIQQRIACTKIGEVLEGEPAPQVWQTTLGKKALLPYPARDEIGRLFET